MEMNIKKLNRGVAKSRTKNSKEHQERKGAVISVYNDLEEHADFEGLRDWLNMCLKKQVSANILAQFCEKVLNEDYDEVKKKTRAQWQKVGIDLLVDDYFSAWNLRYDISGFYQNSVKRGVTRFICFDHNSGFGDIIAIKGKPRAQEVALAVYKLCGYGKENVSRMEEIDYEDAFGSDLDYLNR